MLDNAAPNGTVVEVSSAVSHDVADAKVVRFTGWLLVVVSWIFQGTPECLPPVPCLSESPARDVCAD